MPIFHFDIEDRFRLEDPVGLECPDERFARSTAEQMARQIAIDLGPDDEQRVVVVIDETGHEICKVQIRCKPEIEIPSAALRGEADQ